ncbi:phosphate ABC transporter substrate-binding/OmpA family protein [Paracoccaceae bacterium Fryx2]|nr:phosphate ABC transporter substrate-binding/OmpA family protein [Paracoccaceae bacterium Fryx2]
MGKIWCAAVFAAFLFAGGARAQDVTLTARDGGITLTGTLLGFDGEFYRVETGYGLLTVDGDGVICTGPGCPDLTVPLAVIRILGARDPGMGLLPGVLTAFAQSRGLVIEVSYPETGFAAEITDPVTGKPLARISFAPTGPEAARAAVASGAAELAVAAREEPGMTARVLALDALVPIVAADNRLPRITTADLARALSGGVASWSDLGGPDMPLVLHALARDTSLQEALEARLGRPVAATVVHDDLASLAAAVARDPWALALTGLSAQGKARALAVTDSCGFPLLPTALGVKAGDYPLSLPLFLLTPHRRLPLLAREFIEFLAAPQAQAAVAAGGHINRAAERQPLTADGLRLINAIRGAGDEVTLTDLKRLADLMAGADRLSLTFRFQDGSSALDAQSRENLSDLARLLEVDAFRGQQLILAGFSDGSGNAAANMALSRNRADGVAASLRAAVDLPEGLPQVTVEAFGEALPMACDTTAAGRQLNRRVELWLRPATGSPVP